MWFKFNRISTDLLYARISLRTILEDMDILNESFPHMTAGAKGLTSKEFEGAFSHTR